MSAVERADKWIDVDLATHDLHDLLIALAALTSEVTADVTESEVTQARATLVYEAFKVSRKVRAFFD